MLNDCCRFTVPQYLYIKYIFDMFSTSDDILPRIIDPRIASWVSTNKYWLVNMAKCIITA